MSDNSIWYEDRAPSVKALLAKIAALEAREASLLAEQKRILDFTGGLDPVEWMESEREERERLEAALQECQDANAALLDDGNHTKAERDLYRAGYRVYRDARKNER